MGTQIHHLVGTVVVVVAVVSLRMALLDKKVQVVTVESLNPVVVVYKVAGVHKMALVHKVADKLVAVADNLVVGAGNLVVFVDKLVVVVDKLVHAQLTVSHGLPYSH